MYTFKINCYPVLDNNTYSEISTDYEVNYDFEIFMANFESFMWHILKDNENSNTLYKITIDVLDKDGSYYTDLVYMVYLEHDKCTIVEDIAKFRDFKIGDIVRHFKYEYIKLDDRNKNMFTYKILGFGTHTETKEKMVIYQALYAPFETYVRPYDMFMGYIDHEKYPNTKQVFRLYKINSITK